jgi:hypothetical protein
MIAHPETSLTGNPEADASVFVSRGYYNMISSMLKSIKEMIVDMDNIKD